MADVSFFDRIDLELKRAKRYSVFVSMLLVDLSFVEEYCIKENKRIIDEIYNLIRSQIRVVDFASVIDKYTIGFLFPETSRQGAEIVARRINDIIRQYLSKQNGCLKGRIIPMEMASFPDAAGNKTITEFLREYTEVTRN